MFNDIIKITNCKIVNTLQFLKFQNYLKWNMDYLDGRITKEEFIKSRGVENTQASCKGHCDNMNESHFVSYHDGLKYCRRCCIKTITKKLRCECCNGLLRSKKRERG